MLKVSSPEILEYRKAIEERKLDLPIWERKVITCEEAAAYSGIGVKKLRQLTKIKQCPFVVSVGTQIYIVREKLDDYTNKKKRI